MVSLKEKLFRVSIVPLLVLFLCVPHHSIPAHADDELPDNIASKIDLPYYVQAWWLLMELLCGFCAVGASYEAVTGEISLSWTDFNTWCSNTGRSINTFINEITGASTSATVNLALVPKTVEAIQEYNATLTGNSYTSSESIPVSSSGIMTIGEFSFQYVSDPIVSAWSAASNLSNYNSSWQLYNFSYPGESVSWVETAPGYYYLYVITGVNQLYIDGSGMQFKGSQVAYGNYDSNHNWGGAASGSSYLDHENIGSYWQVTRQYPIASQINNVPVVLNGYQIGNITGSEFTANSYGVSVGYESSSAVISSGSNTGILTGSSGYVEPDKVSQEVALYIPDTVKSDVTYHDLEYGSGASSTTSQTDLDDTGLLTAILGMLTGINSNVETLTDSAAITSEGITVMTPSAALAALQTGIGTKFPFSVPNDVYTIVNKFAATPQAPVFTIPFQYESLVWEMEVDLSPFDSVATVFRALMCILPTIGVIFIAVRFIQMVRE